MGGASGNDHGDERASGHQKATGTRVAAWFVLSEKSNTESAAMSITRSLATATAVVVVATMAALATGDSAPPKERMLSNIAADANEMARWIVVNDGVMGGVSESGLRHNAEGWMTFAGDVSLDRNGGFCSTRIEIEPRLELATTQSIRARVRGDGKTYVLTLFRPGNQGGSWEQRFTTTAGQWQELDLPVEKFKYAYYGPRMPWTWGRDDKPVHKAGAVGFLIADKQEGPFALDVAWVKAVMKPANDAGKK